MPKNWNCLGIDFKLIFFTRSDQIPVPEVTSLLGKCKNLKTDSVSEKFQFFGTPSDALGVGARGPRSIPRLISKLPVYQGLGLFIGT